MYRTKRVLASWRGARGERKKGRGERERGKGEEGRGRVCELTAMVGTISILLAEHSFNVITDETSRLHSSLLVILLMVYPLFLSFTFAYFSFFLFSFLIIFLN